MSSYSRKRPMAGGATRASIAAAIGARNAAKYPYSAFGRMNVKRGTQFSTRMFGPSYSGASYTQQAARKHYGYVGRGKYSLPRFMNDAKLLGSGIESVGNRFLKKGLPLMITRANDLRGFMGKGLYGSQQITGGGAYKAGIQTNTADNALISGGRQAPRSISTNDETDTIILTDCEFVKDVYAPSIAADTSSSYGSETIEINPGLAGFAPNLSQIACNYTEYELQQLVFELRPVISENNVNNGQSGIAMMVFNYNPNEDPYDNKEDVMQAHGSVSGRIVQPIRCGVECDPRKTNKTKFFTRTGPVPYLKDADEYDMGVLTVATNNIPDTFSNKQIYELWVHYKCLLRKRKAGAMRLNNQQRDLFVCSGDITVGTTNLFSSQFTSGVNGVTKSQQNNLFCSISSSTSQALVITFPASFSGNVEIKLVLEGTNMTNNSSTVPTVTALGNVFAVSDMYAVAGGATNDLPGSVETVLSATRTSVLCHYRIKSVTAGINNQLTITTGFLTGGSSAPTVTQWALDIKELTQSHWSSRQSTAPVLLSLDDGVRITPVGA